MAPPSSKSPAARMRRSRRPSIATSSPRKPRRRRKGWPPRFAISRRRIRDSCRSWIALPSSSPIPASKPLKNPRGKMPSPDYFPRLMEVVPIDIFGVHVDVAFPAPLGFKQANLEEFGARICDGTKGLNLRVDQIKLKKWDELFG